MKSLVAVFLLLLLCSTSFGIPGRSMPNHGIMPHVDMFRYFPRDAGMKWEYEITIGEVSPVLTFFQIKGVLEDVDKNVLANWIQITLSVEEGEVYSLVTTFKPKEPFGEFAIWSESVELEIMEDTLGIFAGVQRVCWVEVTYPVHLILQVRDYSYTAWEESIVTVDELFTDSEKHLTRAPVEAFVMCKCPKQYLHFKRIVRMKDQPEVEEIYYYKLDVGLVRFEQKVGGKLSMVWELVGFSVCD